MEKIYLKLPKYSGFIQTLTTFGKVNCESLTKIDGSMEE